MNRICYRDGKYSTGMGSDDRTMNHAPRVKIEISKGVEADLLF
jgi:hypothetical protein